MGASGKFPANMHRDLLGLVGETCITRAWRSTSLFFKVGTGAAAMEKEACIIFPHVLFSAIYEDNPQHFQQVLLGGDASNLKSFSKSMQSNPATARRRTQPSGEALNWTLPLGLYV